MTSTEIGLICGVAGLIIHQLAFQPRWTARIVETMIKDLRQHVKDCNEELAAVRASIGMSNPESAE